MNELTLAWVWQPIVALHVLGGALLAALALFAYLRVIGARRIASMALLVMRLAAIGVVAVLLLGPSREQPRPDQEQSPRLTVLIDTSESMRTADCDSTSRIAHVSTRILDPQLLRRLQDGTRVDVRGFDTRVHPLSLEQLYAAPQRSQPVWKRISRIQSPRRSDS